MLAENTAPVDFGIPETDLSPEELRSKIDQLEQVMLQMEGQIHIEPTHYFADGLYAREITIPKGATLTGKVHKTTHINVISKGDISVLTEQGIKRIKAPATIISPPGTKRVGYAHEETVWTTFHGTDEKDLDKLEAQLVMDSHPELSDASPKQIQENSTCLG